MILAADIGGTKTILALLEERQPFCICAEKKYASASYASLQDIIAEFLVENSCQVSCATLGVAGPVAERRCHATNLPWEIDAEALEKNLNIEQVFLINDLEANAYGINCLANNEIITLQLGKKRKGNQALVSAGTGLGEAGMILTEHGYAVFATEGGHADFAPTSDLEIDLLRYLQEKFSHVSYERVLSGAGLVHIYDFLKTPSDPNFTAAQEVTAGAANNATCQKSLQTFAAIYGGECGNVALKFLSLGGLYLGGGIAPKILPYLQSGDFLARFKAKGRFSSLLSEIPIQVIMNEKTALLGSAYVAFQRKKS